MADILAVGAHPDDVEIAIGGTLVKMIRLGHSVTICHCSDGEPTPFGTHEKRLAEAKAAAEMMGSELEILDLPNRYFFDSVENRVKLANVIRKHRPQLLLCPYPGGAHPDHVTVSHIADAARFYAKLTRHDHTGNAWELAPWWTPEQFYYFLGVKIDEQRPSFIVDINEEYIEKMRILSCYASQFNVDMDNLASTDLWGPMIGRRYGEAFFSRGAIGVRSLFDLVQRPMRGTRKPITTNEPEGGKDN
jgi:bacillithiol biosynthesis deacetylase BshB1